ncbi:pilin [Aliikangiella sp. IMCC44359]|uniref:pilin n=1 Tax=Aliikangiella sp. IMCC44359 TaxID=3459125 RepID=UPI00403B0A64
MLRNIIITLILSFLIIIGIGYAVYNDRDFHEKQLFAQALTQFSLNAQQLEKQFLANSTLPEHNQQLNLNIPSSNVHLPLAIKSDQKTITLLFGNGNSALANQTVILEPYINKARQVRWKCIQGSLLLRYRSKSCQLGKGISIQ